jgi:hypothetical protein
MQLLLLLFIPPSLHINPQRHEIYLRKLTNMCGNLYAVDSCRSINHNLYCNFNPLKTNVSVLYKDSVRTAQ